MSQQLKTMMGALQMERREMIRDASRETIIAWATACMMEARTVLEAHGGKQYADQIIALHAPSTAN